MNKLLLVDKWKEILSSCEDYVQCTLALILHEEIHLKDIIALIIEGAVQSIQYVCK